MKKVNRVSKVAIAALCAAFAVLNVGPLVGQAAKADELENIANETFYCADGDDDFIYGGPGEIADASYEIEYDYKVIVEDVGYYSAPSFGNLDDSMTNTCAPAAGTNVVAFYDRWYENLIPGYTPGLLVNNGYYYFSDMAKPETTNVLKTLYELMDTNVGSGGTSESQFLNGLSEYVDNAGYDLSYTSFYSGAKTVDLDALKDAINQNKVGVIFCSRYNFVYGIEHNDNWTIVAKENANVGHMMMVYGYQTIAYYKNDTNFRTDTFLYVSSGYSGADQGYVELNSYLNIEDALIMTIS